MLAVAKDDDRVGRQGHRDGRPRVVGAEDVARIGRGDARRPGAHERLLDDAGLVLADLDDAGPALAAAAAAEVREAAAGDPAEDERVARAELFGDQRERRGAGGVLHPLSLSSGTGLNLSAGG